MVLDPNYQQIIDEFEACYRSLGISVTPKVHTIFYEIPLFIRRHGKPMGFYSTQKFESIHQDFKATWSYYNVPENHKDFGQKLKSAIVNYNGQHL